ncbi:MAG: liaS [Herbinix sp.]|nr:liaS [Herbinix sp.]
MTRFYLILAQILVILWLFFGMIENMSNTTQELLFAIRFTLFPICFIGGVWLLFALFYAELMTKKNKMLGAAILLPLAVTYAPALTKEYFNLIVVHKVIENPAITHWGRFFQINYSITYIYIIISIIIIMIKSFQDYRKLHGKIILIIMAIVITATVNIVTSQKLIEDPGFDITPVSFAIFFLLVTISIFKFNLIDITQYAAVDVFQNTEEAIIILNTENEMIEFNKKAEEEFKLFPLRKGYHIRHLIEEFKMKCPDQSIIDEIIMQFNQKTRLYHTRFYLSEVNGEPRLYDFYLKSVYDSMNQVMGSLVSIKDITMESKLLIESERSRISGDIHDNLSNMINVVSINLEYALKHYDDKEEAEGCIRTAYQTANGIRINLRRILEELKPMDIEEVGMITALESLFHKVDKAEMKIEFTHHGIDEKAISAAKHGYVIYKTCMEAVNNSYFCGKAARIEVVLSYKDNSIRLFISDDGIGCNSIHKGRGLTAMEERIQALGGNIYFDSTLEEGFHIAVELPFNQEEML